MIILEELLVKRAKAICYSCGDTEGCNGCSIMINHDGIQYVLCGRSKQIKGVLDKDNKLVSYSKPMMSVVKP